MRKVTIEVTEDEAAELAAIVNRGIASVRFAASEAVDRLTAALRAPAGWRLITRNPYTAPPEGEFVLVALGDNHGPHELFGLAARELSVTYSGAASYRAPVWYGLDGEPMADIESWESAVWWHSLPMIEGLA